VPFNFFRRRDPEPRARAVESPGVEPPATAVERPVLEETAPAELPAVDLPAPAPTALEPTEPEPSSLARSLEPQRPVISVPPFVAWPARDTKAALDAVLERRVRIDAFTEYWRLTATATVHGSLPEALERGVPLRLDDVLWGPVGPDSPRDPAPGLRQAAPDDLALVLAEPASDQAVERAGNVGEDPLDANWPVTVEVGDLRVSGTVRLPAGARPEELGATEQRFIPLLGAQVWMRDVRLTPDVRAVLVNRARLRGIDAGARP
jgi:hypothetical protein